ncbi:MAG TPA: hypothetical protein VFU29_14125 [Chitinophagaceae bacterium]|nr:hypothetical protein [Chitinophagaceae bacterium]
MKKVTFLLVSFLSVIFITSCRKENVKNSNLPPVAKAGADLTRIILPVNSVMLDGSNSTDPDNTIVSYEWRKIAGPLSFNIINPNAAQAFAVNLVRGIYKFELKVTDAGGLYSKDTVSINVNEVMIFENLTWQNNSAGKYVYMETTSMPNGYSANEISKVYLYAIIPLPGYTASEFEIQKDGTSTGKFYYRIENNKVVAYQYYDVFSNSVIFLIGSKMKILFE